MKLIKIIYYVDLEDNTKGCLCAIPENMFRNSEKTRKFIANEFSQVFDPIIDNAAQLGDEVAEEILEKGEAELDEYEFGIETVPCLEES